jgi:hypothetical protein
MILKERVSVSTSIRKFFHDLGKIMFRDGPCKYHIPLGCLSEQEVLHQLASYYSMKIKNIFHNFS